MKTILTRTLTGGGGLVLAAGLVCIGCDRNEVKVYQVEKEKETSAAGQAHAHPQGTDPHGMDPHGGMAVKPEVQWKLPSNWLEQPKDSMRVGHFNIPGPDDQSVDVSILPIAAMSAPRVEIVNLWRQQVQLTALNEAEAAKAAEKVQLANQPADLYDFASSEVLLDGKYKARIQVIMQERDGTLWFIKATGPDELVKKSKASLVEFAKNLEIKPPAPVAMSPMGAPMAGLSAPEPQALPQWQPPTNWQNQPPSQMLLAKFIATGEGDAKAEITVSALPGTGGGDLSNVNRWRGQLGLASINDAELQKSSTRFDVAGGKALMVDLQGISSRTGKPARMLAASVMQGGQTWFYKMLGDEKVVAAQQEAFVKFVQTVKY